MAACLKCRQPYRLASVGQAIVWLAVEPFSARLCGTRCEIGAR